MRCYMAGRGSGRIDGVSSAPSSDDFMDSYGDSRSVYQFQQWCQKKPKGIVNEDPTVFGGELRVSLHGILMGQLLIS